MPINDLVSGMLKEEGGFQKALKDILENELNMTVNEFCRLTGVSQSTMYKILEEIDCIRRFQLIQRAPDRVELRLTADDPKAAFAQASHALNDFFGSKGLTVEITPSAEPPQADKTSGKFKHIYKDFD